MFDVAFIARAYVLGSRPTEASLRLYTVLQRCTRRNKKIYNPSLTTVDPWATGRAWAFAPEPPRVPARLRVGGRVWRRFFGYPSLGDLATGSKTGRPDPAWVRVRGNRLRCSRASSRISGGISGGMLPVALADGKGMATVREALGLAD